MREGQTGYLTRRRFLAMFAGGVAGVFVSRTAQASSPYLDPDGRFALLVADGWTLQLSPPPGTVAGWVPQSGGALFSISHEIVSNSVDTIGYAQAILGYVARYPGFQQLDTRVIVVAGQYAPLLDYLLDDGSGAQRVQQVILVQTPDAWTLTYRTARDDAGRYSEDAGAMIATFVI